jgi:hypothetical protein
MKKPEACHRPLAKLAINVSRLQAKAFVRQKGAQCLAFEGHPADTADRVPVDRNVVNGLAILAP